MSKIKTYKQGDGKRISKSKRKEIKRTREMRKSKFNRNDIQGDI